MCAWHTSTTQQSAVAGRQPKDSSMNKKGASSPSFSFFSFISMDMQCQHKSHLLAR